MPGVYCRLPYQSPSCLIAPVGGNPGAAYGLQQSGVDDDAADGALHD